MSLQWTLVASYLYLEIAVVLLLSLPFIKVTAWQKLFKSRFLQVLSKQAQWYFAIACVMLVLLLLDAIREMRKYSAKESGEHSHLESELQISMRLFRAQRNFYISGFALFLTIVIKRLADLISKQAHLSAENEAALKQARSATATASSFLKQASGESAQNNSNEDQEEVDKLKEVIEELNKKLELLEKDKSAVLSQAKSVEKEYDRLNEEHRKLQLKLNVEGETKKDD